MRGSERSHRDGAFVLLVEVVDQFQRGSATSGATFAFDLGLVVALHG
jgi:hypothetical protein